MTPLHHCTIIGIPLLRSVKIKQDRGENFTLRDFFFNSTGFLLPISKLYKRLAAISVVHALMLFGRIELMMSRNPVYALQGWVGHVLNHCFLWFDRMNNNFRYLLTYLVSVTTHTLKDLT